MKTIESVLHFWFVECSPRDWFKKDVDFDIRLAARFGTLVEQALSGGLEDWTQTADGCLALILVLDQFPRGMYRNTPKAFAGDTRGLSLSQRCLERGHVAGCADPAKRHFMLIPMMHSENLNVQNQALPLFKQYTSNHTYNFALKHQQIIKKFGRFPHRNKILGRLSTEEELSFLKKPGSSF